jgi:hypothetical protein
MTPQGVPTRCRRTLDRRRERLPDSGSDEFAGEQPGVDRLAGTRNSEFFEGNGFFR